MDIVKNIKLLGLKLRSWLMIALVGSSILYAVITTHKSDKTSTATLDTMGIQETVEAMEIVFWAVIAASTGMAMMVLFKILEGVSHINRYALIDQFYGTIPDSIEHL